MPAGKGRRRRIDLPRTWRVLDPRERPAPPSVGPRLRVTSVRVPRLTRTWAYDGMLVVYRERLDDVTLHLVGAAI